MDKRVFIKYLVRKRLLFLEELIIEVKEVDFKVLYLSLRLLRLIFLRFDCRY